MHNFYGLTLFWWFEHPLLKILVVLMFYFGKEFSLLIKGSVFNPLLKGRNTFFKRVGLCKWQLVLYWWCLMLDAYLLMPFKEVVAIMVNVFNHVFLYPFFMCVAYVDEVVGLCFHGVLLVMQRRFHLSCLW